MCDVRGVKVLVETRTVTVDKIGWGFVVKNLK